MTEQPEDDFLSEYDPAKYPPVAVASDVAAFSIRNDALVVLAARRAQHPFKGRWALPGTFIEPGEDAYDAAVRAITLRTGIVPVHIEQIASYSEPDRDPRMRVLSVAYLALGPFRGEIVAGYHSTEADWLPVHGESHEWAFDHKNILRDALERLQSKMEYTTVATSFLPDTFTVADLLRIYQTVWDRPLDTGNFYRKVKASKGFLETTGEKFRRNIYRAGKAKMLYPPIRKGDWS
jgi:8-oxo-dGTP diphosphatase